MAQQITPLSAAQFLLTNELFSFSSRTISALFGLDKFQTSACLAVWSRLDWLCELNNIRWYILNNPINWQLDRDNSQNIRKLSLPEKVEEYVKDMDEMALNLRKDKR